MAQRDERPFWRRKRLDELSQEEWESLCDGCGRCCLHKLEDADSGELYQTNVACKLLDLHACRCRHYGCRRHYVPDCIRLSPALVPQLPWLPETCAYRRLSRGQDLPSWHPLITGDPESVHRAGVSVRGWAISESEVDGDLEDYLIASLSCQS
ncbi:MAG TPA: YcgN family cysteine cluster protein [Candidatus Competibacteraceae bacterium]|nr:YcgN family cysteine cluster protein [Candidatus Competibacteraceae bacterium]